MSDMNFQYQINGKSVEVRFSESSPFVDIWESSPETIDQAKFLCHWVGVQFQLFNKSSLYIEELGVPDLSNYEGLVFFPGSFHPWHDGHRACLDESGRDIIIVCPDQNPWKEDLEESHDGEFYLALNILFIQAS